MQPGDPGSLREPLLPPMDANDATLSDIQAEKLALVHNRDALAGGMKLPACIDALRSTFICKMLVARNPKTQLNELHVAQPIMLLLLAIGLALLPVTGLLLSNAYFPLATEALGVAALCALTSLGLSIVGFIARAIPSHEDLNVKMSEQVDTMGGGVEGVEVASDDAAALERRMSVGWVGERRKTRDATRELQAAYVKDVQLAARFEFQVKLLEYLASGETQRATRQQRRLEEEFERNYDEMAKLYANPIAELKRKKGMFGPNGRLSREEVAHPIEGRMRACCHSFRRHPADKHADKPRVV